MTEITQGKPKSGRVWKSTRPARYIQTDSGVKRGLLCQEGGWQEVLSKKPLLTLCFFQLIPNLFFFLE